MAYRRTLAWRYSVVLLTVTVARASRAQEVTITGGAMEPHLYHWTVLNRKSSPITSVEFPHYHADLFDPVPDGWTYEATAVVGQPDGGGDGHCVFTATARHYGIRLGESLEFAMRIAPAGAIAAPGTVVVGWADGTTVRVPGVEVPSRESWFRRNFPMVGLGGSFLLFVVVAHLWRKRKPERPTGVEESGGADPAPR
jgi:hypothetical protein